jgi:hypothetical protein
MFQVTGNEYLSLPEIDEKNGNVNYLTVLHMNSKGMLQIEGKPFLKTKVVVDNKYISFNNNLVWIRDNYWIPTATYSNDDVKIKIIYLTPLNQKAIAIRVEVDNLTDHKINVEASIQLEWTNTMHVVNESIALDTTIKMKKSSWNEGNVFMQNIVTPLIAIAPMHEGDSKYTLDVKESSSYDLFVGLGLEEVSASTAAKHLKRVGFEKLLNDFNLYLSEKVISFDVDEKINRILNTNLFFSLFYSTGLTFDSESLVLVTSRSPRYYVSAAYWDRDSLLWSFPSLLLVDTNLCKDILDYVFKTQINRVGEHSRYIDGTLLEPGFELDELCAPVIALEQYIKKTDDKDILKSDYILEGLKKILRKLLTKRNKEVALYETFLMPSDDIAKEKYLTYDNVLVWKALNLLAKYLKCDDLSIEAKKVKDAINKYLVEDDMFIFSSDLNGNTSVYDEPPGSLQLLPFLGFCPKSSKKWLNTVKLIRSSDYKLSFAGCNINEIGCEHAPHPWILSICNSLLSGFGDEAMENLSKVSMDNFIACESVDEETGLCTTGEAFATCAGFLSYSLYTYLNSKKKYLRKE